MNVRVSVGGEDDNDRSYDSDSELAQVKQKVEDEGDPWAANEERMMPSEENLLLSAKGETGLGGGLGDDVSHRVRISYLFRHYLILDVLNNPNYSVQGDHSGQRKPPLDLDLGCSSIVSGQ